MGDYLMSKILWVIDSVPSKAVFVFVFLGFGEFLFDPLSDASIFVSQALVVCYFASYIASLTKVS